MLLVVLTCESLNATSSSVLLTCESLNATSSTNL